jgi:transglutaminase-like putative cysteine protease
VAVVPATPLDVTVHVDLALSVDRPGRLAVSLGVADHLDRTERLTVTGPDGPVVADVVATGHGTRLHLVEAREGDLDIGYDTTVHLPAGVEHTVSDADRFTYLLPSRYCPSDLVGGFAVAELGGYDEADTARAVMAWVHGRTSYEPGSTGASDDALTPLHTAAGVCRDFAHLGVTLCRALSLPARYVSVYAPGLAPMDAHAVVEVAIGERWYVFDPTRLAPRASLVRIGTGRDAADVALSSSLGAVTGAPTFDVTATVSPDLPADDPDELVALA